MFPAASIFTPAGTAGEAFAQQVITYHVPYVGNANTLHYQPSQFSTGGRLLAYLRGETVCFDVIDSRGAEQVRQDANAMLNSMQGNLGYLSHDISRFNQGLNLSLGRFSKSGDRNYSGAPKCLRLLTSRLERQKTFRQLSRSRLPENQSQLQSRGYRMHHSSRTGRLTSPFIRRFFELSTIPDGSLSGCQAHMLGRTKKRFAIISFFSSSPILNGAQQLERHSTKAQKPTFSSGTKNKLSL